VIPWVLTDSNYVRISSQKLDPNRTIFVGGLHGMMNAGNDKTLLFIYGMLTSINHICNTAFMTKSETNNGTCFHYGFEQEDPLGNFESW